MLRAAALVAGLLAVTAPNVRKLGNAIVEYRDQGVHAVTAYEYSYRHHDGGWLLFETAVRTADDQTFHHRDFILLTPDETTVPLATEQRYLEDGSRIRQIHQNAGLWSRDLTSYFISGGSSIFRFFSLPGEGVVTDSIVTDRNSSSRVTLYFVSPEGSWHEGTYQLTIDNGRVRAMLPIELK